MEEKEIDYLLTLGNLCTTVAAAIGASVYFDYQHMGHIMKPISFWVPFQSPQLWEVYPAIFLRPQTN